MRISIQKQTQTPEQKAAGDDGEMLTVSSAEFETIAQAKRFLYNIQQKYGQIRHQEYFSPEQGSAGYYTEAKQDNDKIITYWFYFDGFEGELLNMLKQNIRQASRKIISSRDVIAGPIDYSKSADRDALALENLAKKLHEYLTSGRTDNAQLNNYAVEIMDIANDLSEVLPRITIENEGGLGDDYAGLGAGASQHVGLSRSAGAVKAAIEDLQEEMSMAAGEEISFEAAWQELNNRTKEAGLTKEAASECRHCDFIARDPYELTEHENEKHLGQKPFKPLNRNYGFNLLNTTPERRPKTKFDRKLRGDDLEPEEEL